MFSDSASLKCLRSRCESSVMYFAKLLPSCLKNNFAKKELLSAFPENRFKMVILTIFSINFRVSIDNRKTLFI